MIKDAINGKKKIDTTPVKLIEPFKQLVAPFSQIGDVLQKGYQSFTGPNNTASNKDSYQVPRPIPLQTQQASQTAEQQEFILQDEPRDVLDERQTNQALLDQQRIQQVQQGRNKVLQQVQQPVGVGSEVQQQAPHITQNYLDKMQLEKGMKNRANELKHLRAQLYLVDEKLRGRQKQPSTQQTPQVRTQQAPQVGIQQIPQAQQEGVISEVQRQPFQGGVAFEKPKEPSQMPEEGVKPEVQQQTQQPAQQDGISVADSYMIDFYSNSLDPEIKEKYTMQRNGAFDTQKLYEDYGDRFINISPEQQILILSFVTEGDEA